MDRIFLQILNMSMTSSIVIFFVILTRFLLKKAPKVYSYVLWFIVFLRLVTPISFESIFSLIPTKTNIIPTDIMLSKTPQINSGINAIDGIVNSSLPKPLESSSINPIHVWIAIGMIIWLSGMLLITAYSIVTTLRLKKILHSSKLLRANIYETEYMTIPFIFGTIKPKIYIPTGLAKIERDYIVRHEEIHIKRNDHLVKLLAFIIATIHWFNPLVWLSYSLMSKDMELSCDEAVIREMGSTIKRDYSTSLLRLSAGKNILVGSPLAFSGKNTKSRIKNILDYKKPTFWLSFVGVFAIIFLSITLLSNPRDNSVKIDPNDIALQEVQKITSEHGYSVSSTIGEDILIGDSDVFQFIKEASLESGYFEDDFNSMSEYRKIYEYPLNEKSKNNEPISLGIVVDQEKAIGAYLYYSEYSPGIKPISSKEFADTEVFTSTNDSAQKIVDEFLAAKVNLYDRKDEIDAALNSPDTATLENNINTLLQNIRILFTEKEYQRLIANRSILDEDLKNELYVKMEISNLKYELISESADTTSYKVTYTKRLFSKDELKLQQEHTSNFVLNKIEGQWLISNLN